MLGLPGMSPDGQAPARNDTPEKPVQTPDPGAGVPAAPGGPDPSSLSPAEQMALFEKDLKENDWGHQPC
jgi:hypothetical protein